MRIAFCQQEIAFEDKNENLKRICSFVEKAKKENAEVIFFPEMSFTGFSMNIKNTVEKSDDNINIIKNLAVNNYIYIGFGWVNSILDKAENHYSVVSPKGEFICDYIKIHPFSYAGEDDFFVAGNRLAFFNINNIKFSVFICYDLRFPEIFQSASKKADVIIIAANWPEKRKEHWKTLLKARAIENQCYIIGVNCFGIQKNIFYSGDSRVYNPDGKIICFAKEKEDMVIFDFSNDTEKYRKAFPVKGDRKNEFYKKIL